MAKKHSVAVSPGLRNIMPRFLEIRHEELALVQAALAEGDTEQIVLYGHRLKGSGGSFGLARLSDMGAALEDAGRAGDVAAAAAVVAELADYLDNLEITYEARA